MRVMDLLDFAKAYSDLGSMVTKQLDDLFNGDFESVNYNAIKLIDEKLSNYHDDICDIIDEYIDWRIEQGLDVNHGKNN